MAVQKVRKFIKGFFFSIDIPAERPRGAFQRPSTAQMNTLLSSFDQSQMSSFKLGLGQETIRGQTPETLATGAQAQAPRDPFLPGLTLGGQVSGQRQSVAPQPAPSVRPSPQSVESHPSDILNRLSEAEQQKFLEQFLSLAPEHQSFVYRKLLTSSPDIQQFAIAQFISLDNRVLVVSIQAELDKENKRKSPADQQFIGPNLPTQASTPVRQPQTFPNNPFGQTSTDLRNLNPDKLTIEELVTLQVRVDDKYRII